ncbi:unnamed protein product [Durusdinium trenchii]|uniref:tRNA1(Val) (Adenine(37)-N6)-methyltransferase (tRNA m6A37 methyltransferase) n=2 Tax=Durusdinium trenchii TaxID=1381693 RepID=A0ABP0HTU8_9DINO
MALASCLAAPSKGWPSCTWRTSQRRAPGPAHSTLPCVVACGSAIAAVWQRTHQKHQRFFSARASEPRAGHLVLQKDCEVTKSRFCRGWSISQLREGYRYCADDILCAYLAWQADPKAQRLLDLGSGIGSIGLAWLAQQPRGAKCTMLEAQEVSVQLCRQTLEALQVKAVDLRHGDLRDPSTLQTLGTNFDLVTANPPYFTSTSGNLPKNSQKAYCRHELRGGVSEFCSAAAQLLSPNGSFCMVHASPRLTDVLTALERYHFTIQRRVDIFFRGNYKSVAVVCSPKSASNGQQEAAAERLQVIEEDGSWSPGYLEICELMGL